MNHQAHIDRLIDNYLDNTKSYSHQDGAMLRKVRAEVSMHYILDTFKVAYFEEPV